MQKELGNVSRTVKILRKNQREMLFIKNTETKMENAIDGLISWLDRGKKLWAWVLSIETSKTEKEREQNWKKKKHNTISKDCATTTKSCNIHVMGMSEGKKGTEQKKYMKQWQNFPQISGRKPQIQEVYGTPTRIMQKTLHLSIAF